MGAFSGLLGNIFFYFCCMSGSAQEENCPIDAIRYVQDGFCDPQLNNPSCNYDGGDCCECTCIDNFNYACGYNGFSCLDPSALCYDPDLALYSNCTDGVIGWIGDGYCDKSQNSVSCAYDGGDCCECTCVEESLYPCGVNGYLCADPGAQCYNNAIDTVYSSCNGTIDYVGNYRCDLENNNPSCAYDWGDCCECTCEDSINSTNSCESYSFVCMDPNAPCFEPDASLLFSNCGDVNGTNGYLGDGWCDPENNNPSCNYDLGDCCACTCRGDANYPCGSNGFSCIDPDGPEELFDCDEPPRDVLSCDNSAPRTWVVTNSSQAEALADAVACSGGYFDVNWIGNVTMSRPFLLMNGTALSVNGVGASSAIDGGGLSRLFTVVNASLQMRDVNVTNGNATSGGAIAVSGGRLTLNRTMFLRNNASTRGGALFVSSASDVFFDGETRFSDNFAGSGGALSVTNGSKVSWAGDVTFSGNFAVIDGGAISVKGGSNASWFGEASSTFTRNIVSGGTVGAVHVADRSSASWEGIVRFTLNSIAVSVIDYSDAIWSGETTFEDNSGYYGGAIQLMGYSNALWTGSATFLRNDARIGGAMYVTEGSTAAWNSAVRFDSNSALDEGGAIFTSYDSTIVWNGKTLFVKNNAGYGGALFITDRSTVVFNDNANFSSNGARLDGGGLGSKAFESTSSSDSSTDVDGDVSRVIFLDETTFFNNTSGANGGAIAMLGMLSLSFDSTVGINFSRNSAGAEGGAIYIGATNVGPVFTRVNFVSNYAQVGGAVQATGSGTESTENERGIDETWPVSFVQCKFFYNVAEATGGAFDSTSGYEQFIDTLFANNSARAGGALRLASRTTLSGCVFEENISGVGEGPAVSNIGVMENLQNNTFSSNMFDCEASMFLSLSESGNLYETVCHGCEACPSCLFPEPQSVPKCLSLPDAGIEHATSPGGVTTIQELTINEGYWRATEDSLNILECYNKQACRGGRTGASNFCRQGYEGPYCAVCSKDYTTNLGSTCTPCSDNTVGIIVTAISATISVLVGASVVSYLTSGEEESARHVLHCLARNIPLQSVKIIIVAWQILTQFTSVAHVTYPDVYQCFLDSFEFLNFDLSWVIAIGCIVEIDFHDRLLISTIGPILIMVLLGVTYNIAVRRNRGSEAALETVRHKHVFMVLLMTFLVYSNVSSVVFQTFDCDSLDSGNVYLQADYSINCDSKKHKALQIYAGFMVAVYPFGIPVFYAVLLWRNRKMLQDEVGRNSAVDVQPTSELWKPYKPSRFYYEVVECGRRILLTSVVFLVDDDTVGQIAVSLTIAVIFAITSEGLSPYGSRLDTWVSRAGHAVVAISIYFALLMKLDVSSEGETSQRALEVILVSLHVCMILAVVVEAIVLAFALRVEHRETVQQQVVPVRRTGNNVSVNRENSLVEIGEDTENSDSARTGEQVCVEQR